MDGTRWILAAAVGLAVVGAGAGVGIATGGPSGGPAQAQELPDEAAEAGEEESADSDQPPPAADAEEAETAALAWAESEYGTGARVVEVEQGDDGAAFGVEIVLADGRQVEVHLDAAFNVSGHEFDED